MQKCLTLFYSLIIIGYSKIRCLPCAPEGEADGGQDPSNLYWFKKPFEALTPILLALCNKLFEFIKLFYHRAH